jgi:hypothetical protein
LDRFVRQKRLAEVGDAGQARLLAAEHRVAGTDGADTERAYLTRAGFRAVTEDALAEPRPFVHAGVFRHAGPRSQAAGAWRALIAIREVLEQPTA